MCLVEGCSKHFSTFQERRQHLVDAHSFPRAFNFAKISARHHGSQPRPGQDPPSVSFSGILPSGATPKPPQAVGLDLTSDDGAVPIRVESSESRSADGTPLIAELRQLQLTPKEQGSLQHGNFGQTRGRTHGRARGRVLLGRGRRGRGTLVLT